MSSNDQIIAMLARIEENQRKALETQQQHLRIAQAQLDRSNKTIQESVELQRTAISRQGQILKVVMPLIALLLMLLGYVLFKWRAIL